MATSLWQKHWILERNSILLLIGILIGFGVSRVRKRMGLGVTWSTWVTTVVVVGFILLLLWVSAYKH